MLYPSINEIRKKVDSRYSLVILAAKRARDLIDGKPQLTEETIERPVSIAAYEIAEDLIGYRRPEAQAADVAEAAEEVDSEEVVEADAAETVEEIPAEADDDIIEIVEE